MDRSSKEKPWRFATRRSSRSLSESVTYNPFSPRRAPSSRNCSASVVLPVPGSPSTKYNRSASRPPHRTLSSPGTPVERRASPPSECSSFMGSKGPSLAVRHDRSLHVEPSFPPIITPNQRGSQRYRLPRRKRFWLALSLNDRAGGAWVKEL